MQTLATLLTVLAAAFTATTAQNVTVNVPSFDVGSIQLLPTGSWAQFGATGSYNGASQFLLGNQDQGKIIFTFPTASKTFEWWGFVRSGGGRATVSIDGGATTVVDYYDPNSNGSEPPSKLYSITNLTFAVHTVTIINIADTRIGPNHFDQMNLDRFTLVGAYPKPQAAIPTFPTGTTLGESPLSFSYHAHLALGADSPLNGGNGSTVEILFDTGASAGWVTWVGCVDPDCDGHDRYRPSLTSQHFSNSSIEDGIFFGDKTWRVNDTVTLGSVTVPSSTFGAAFEMNQEGTLDGNFGMGKSYCAGELCSLYPNFVENAYEQGIIKSPTLSFYQLMPTDTPASGVTSMVAIGGVDRNKYTGAMDWIPLVGPASQWQSPWNKRLINAGSGNVDATTQFTHMILTFDTGNPGHVGLPSDDWAILVSLVSGFQDAATGDWLFPCASTMTWNFNGSQNRDYTFPLTDGVVRQTVGGKTFCHTTTNDAGATQNWITGLQFMGNYYLAHHFGARGVGSSLGFGIKNLAASASTSSPVIGTA